jgi:ribonuclease BN (tRNA processing enzyme)
MPAGETDDLFRVHILGVGNYFSELHSTVSFLVRAGERLILVEAPSELPKKLKDYRESMARRYLGGAPEVAGLDALVLDNINDVVVTHDHGDHSSGLELIAFYKRFVQKPRIFDEGGVKPRIYGPIEVLDSFRASLYNKLDFEGKDFFGYFQIVPMREDSLKRIGDAELTIRLTDHKIPGFGIMLSYRGRRFGYSSDTCFSEPLAEFLHKSDVLVHECDGSSVVHTTPEQLAGWRDRSGYSGRLYVCHFADAACFTADERIRKLGLVPLPENSFIDI